MDFISVIGVALRRWKITVPVFVVGMALVLRIASGLGTEFESLGTVIILPPSVTIYDLSADEEYEDEANIYIENPRSTRTLAATALIAVGASEVRIAAADAGLSPNYEVVVDDVEPILYITAKGETAAQSSDTLDFVIFELARELAVRQGVTPDIPAELVATMEVLSELRAIEDTSGGLKVMGTLGIVVVLLTVMAAFITEGLVDRMAVNRARVATA